MVWKVFSNSEEIMEYSQAVISYRKLICPAQQKDFLGLFGGHFGPAVEELGELGLLQPGTSTPQELNFLKVKHF